MNKHILNDFFDEIIVISTEQSFNHWSNLNKEFIKRNIFVTRIEYAKEYEFKILLRDYPNKIDNGNKNFIIRNLTLFKIFKYIDSTLNKKFLILTDKVKFCRKFERKISNSILEIKKGSWDFWYLGYDSSDIPKRKYYNNLMLSKNTKGLYALAFNNNSYIKILNQLTRHHNNNIDIVQLIESFQNRPPFIIYSSVEKLFHKV